MPKFTLFSKKQFLITHEHSHFLVEMVKMGKREIGRGRSKMVKMVETVNGAGGAEIVKFGEMGLAKWSQLYAVCAS